MFGCDSQNCAVRISLQALLRWKKFTQFPGHVYQRKTHRASLREMLRVQDPEVVLAVALAVLIVAVLIVAVFVAVLEVLLLI